MENTKPSLGPPFREPPDRRIQIRGTGPILLSINLIPYSEKWQVICAETANIVVHVCY